MTAFLVLLFAYMLSQFYRSFLAVVSVDVARDLGLDAAGLGSLSAAWFAAFAFAQFPIGYALDTIGPRRTLAAGMAAAMAGAGWLSVATGFWGGLAAMALIGAGCAPVLMAGMYLFARTYPADRFAVMSSSLIGLASIGNLLGASPLAWAAGRFGWRASMLAIAGVTALSAVAVAWLLRDPPPIAGDEADERGMAAGIAAIGRIGPLWLLFPITAVSYATVIAARSLWIGPYLAAAHGLDATATGQAALAMALAMSAGALAYGPVERWAGAKRVVFFGAAASALGFLALGIWGVASATLSVAALVVIGGSGMTYAILMAHGRAFMPPALIGRGVTTMNFAFIGGAGLVQWLSGHAVQTALAAGTAAADVYGWLFLAYGAALVVALAIYGFAPARPSRPIRPARSP